AAKSAPVARNSAYVSGVIYLIFGSIPVIIGLIGPEIIGELSHHEDFIITVAQKFLPPFAFVLFSGALISAILATIDSILLSVAALLSHNLFIPALQIQDEKLKVRWARAFIVLAAFVCIALAFSSDSIYSLVETASSFGTAGILVITLLGLHGSWGGARAATWALIAGLGLMPLFEYVIPLQAPFVATILGSLCFYVLGAIGFKRASGGTANA
ncbi:MAG: sodium:solute symporter, partial [Pseudomonadota bacterium]